ncbi:MAG TPA: hypothetical protein VF602_00695 [Pedobacter sp.]|jgi:hypothetical protein
MKTYLNNPAEFFNLSTRRIFRHLILFITLSIIMMLSSIGAQAQNYLVTYSGLNLDARDLAYYPAKKQFIISSAQDGQLGFIDSEGGYSLLLKDSLLIGATGLKINGDFLYVLTGNSVISSQANTHTDNQTKLVKVNLLDKTIIYVQEIDKLYKGPHFISDLAIDGEGAVYIVDAQSPVIYKIQSDGTGSVLLEDSRLNTEAFQTKTISYHKNGYLLVAVNSTLLKIDLSNTNSISEVYIEEGLGAIASLHFTPEHLLILSEVGESGKIHILNSTNSWASGNVLRTDTSTYLNPVNTDFVKNKIYVLDSHKDKVSSSDFSVRVIDLQKYPSKNKRKGRVIVGEVTVSKKGF